MIDNWLARHQGELLAWVLNNPANLMSAIAVLILVIIGVDWYFETQKQNSKTMPKKTRTRKKVLSDRQSGGLTVEKARDIYFREPHGTVGEHQKELIQLKEYDDIENKDEKIC